MKTITTLSTLGVAAGVGLIALRWAASEAPIAPNVSELGSAGPASGLAPQRGSGPQAPASEEDDEDAVAWLNTYDLRVRARAGAPELGVPGLDLTISGTLRAEPLQANEGRKVELNLSEVLVRQPVRSERVLDLVGPDFQRQLARPFVVHFDDRGRVQRLIAERQASPAARGVFRMLATSLQFSAPKAPGARSWQAPEVDTLGEALVEYRRLGAHSYSKIKRRYLRMLSPQGFDDSAGDRQVSSIARWKNGAEGELHSLDVLEKVLQPGASASFETHTELKLVRRQREALYELRGDSTIHELAEVPLDSLPAARSLDVDPEQPLTTDDTLRGLSGEVANFNGADGAVGRQLLARLEALLRAHPEQATGLVRALGGAEPHQASLLLSALGAAGTPEAQAALRSVLEEGSSDPRHEATAMALLGLADAPAPESAELAREVSADEQSPHRHTALLTCGNMVAALSRRGDAEAAADIFADLAERLESTQDSVERYQLLAAIGNTGHSEAPAVVAELVQSPDEGMRAAAAHSLRLVDTDEALQALTQLATDGSAEVRREAVAALSNQVDQGMEVLAAALESDPDEGVRAEALHAVVRSSSPLVEQMLEAVAENDASDSLRAQARELLENRS